jgi:hypothetical protein
MQDCDTSHVSPASRLSVLVIPFKPESHSRGMRMPRRSCARRWRALTARIRSQNPKGSASGIPTLLQTARKDGLPANRGQKARGPIHLGRWTAEEAVPTWSI